MDQIFLFGDSLTQFSGDQDTGFSFTAALQHAYIRKLDVTNRGYSGYNTLQALRVLPHLIPPPTPQSRIALFVVFLGANDARLPDQDDASSPQSVPLDAYAANLHAILSHPSVAAHDPRFMLVTPPPVDERACMLADHAKGYVALAEPPRRTAERTAAFARRAQAIGRDAGVSVCDLWGAFVEAASGKREGFAPGLLPGSREAPICEGLGQLLCDGLHFTGQGYKLLYREFMATVARDIPELLPERLEMVYPAWNDVQRWERFS